MVWVDCTWIYDEQYDCWRTACGHAFSLIDGTPAENGMKFCPFCGRGLTVVESDEEEGSCN